MQTKRENSICRLLHLALKEEKPQVAAIAAGAEEREKASPEPKKLYRPAAREGQPSACKNRDGRP